jgi:rhodanese-related sulfurtransferase
MQIRRWIFVISAVFLLNIVLIAGCRQPTTQTVSVAVPTITVSDADKLISENVGNQDFVILDVRTPDEYTARHIAGAIDISYESAQFKNDVDKLDRNKQYLVYCQTGVNSAVAAQIMAGLGFKDVQDITGGYAAWVQAGYMTCGCPGTVISR